MRKKKLDKRRVLPLLLSAMMLGSFVPTSVFAETTKENANVIVKEELPTESKENTTKTIQNTQSILIDENIFPDRAFRTYVSSHFDTDRDEQLSTEEINQATVIDFEWDDTISDLTGLNLFTNLEQLKCAGTSLSSLDVSENTKLKILDCSYIADLSSIDVTNNLLLENFECYETKISSLDVSKNTALIRLDCNNTKITALDVSINKDLFALNCEDTKVDTLNIRNNPKLYEVYITNTPIHEMDYSQNPELVHIRVGGTNITKLDVSKNLKLAALLCNNTQIKELDLSNNLGMYEIFCYNTPIERLDLSKFSGFHTLEAYNTNLSQLDISNNPNIVGLDISNTKINSLNTRNNPKLMKLKCDNTEIAALDLRQNSLLNYLDCSNTKVTTLDVSILSDLEKLYCANTGIKSLNLTNSGKLAGLDCSGNEVTELNLSNITDLWMGGTVSPQKRTVYYQQSAKEITFDLKTIVSDISKVALENGTNYTYDKQSGILTLQKPETTEISYQYTHGYLNTKKVPPMQVTLQLKKEYKMTSKEVQTFENKDMIFTSEADFDKFEKVLVDEVEVASSNYSVSRGSTIVTLKKEFLQTLSAGQHMIRIVSSDGMAESKIIVPAKAVPIETPEKSTANNALTESKKSPQTGDNTPLLILIGSAITAIGIIRKIKPIS